MGIARMGLFALAMLAKLGELISERSGMVRLIRA